jgi:dTDP-4-amino-4,6-dideoxygalactose transaminase
MKVPFQDFHQPYAELKEELDAAYLRFMESGWFVLGGETAAFEEEYAAFCGAAHAVGVANGLEALHLALLALGVKPGDEVIVPSNTYIATWLAVTQAGAKPVPVEPDRGTFNIDPEKIEAAISRRTKAILAVNLYGQPCDYDQIRKMADDHGLHFAIDNAQAQGARYKGRSVGGLADIECHSFYPSKNLGAYGEAGAVTTNDPDLAEKIKVLRNYGSRVRYHNEVVGFNSRIDELQAAFLRVKLRHLDEWNSRRARVAGTYLEGLADNESLILPRVPDWADPVWHLFVIRHPRRDALQQHLTERGVASLIHYPIPPHRSGAYSVESGNHSWPDLPIAESLAEEILSLPIGPHLREEQLSAVCNAVREFVN